MMMASLMWLLRSLVSVALYILSINCDLEFVSPFVITSRIQRQRNYLALTTCCTASIVGEDVSDSPDKVKTKATGKKKTFSKKKTSISKAKGIKELKNGAKTESEASSKTKKKRKKKKDEGPAYWRNETDHFILLDRNSQITTCTNETHMVQFLVRGNPRPLRRHRTARGFMYNPSANYQATFRQVVQEMVWSSSTSSAQEEEEEEEEEKEKEESTPIFLEDEQLAMRLVFHMKRPKLHFVGGKPGPGRLRPKAPGRLAPTRTDVDNLAKFVLDSLNGLLYVDDRQVASIHATKIYDNDGHCQGCIDVSIQRLVEEDIEDLLG